MQPRGEMIKIPNQPISFVLHRRDNPVGIPAHVPPLIAADAVAIRVSARPNRRMSRSRLRIGVVEITRTEIRTTLQKQIESVRRLQRVSRGVEMLAPRPISDQE